MAYNTLPHIFTTMCTLLLLSVIPVTVGQEDSDECSYPTNTVPYITFLDVRLPNHSFLDVDRLASASYALQCHTDLSSCCDPSSGVHTGQWILPNGGTVREVSEVPTTFDYTVIAGEQKITLTFNGTISTALQGIFRCDIPTESINNASSTTKTSVYVGIYEEKNTSELRINNANTKT